MAHPTQPPLSPLLSRSLPRRYVPTAVPLLQPQPPLPPGHLLSQHLQYLPVTHARPSFTQPTALPTPTTPPHPPLKRTLFPCQSQCAILLCASVTFSCVRAYTCMSVCVSKSSVYKIFF
ncbi:hypothetical protein JZ751_007934 [Albula glossodonta]|uniref:Uncharacterized protein n=1 Tax=Albula glossodonta TaxID=121402 RepID=A0A8T2P316_9TELE|nr:hypothetical protein JZ751_007934 [Albula glossodonta]